jgi:hypothetical protein
MSRLGETKRKRDKAASQFESADFDSRYMTREAAVRHIDAAHEALVKADADVRHWEAHEAWSLAKKLCGAGNVDACATFAAGLVQANARIRAAELAAKESQRTQEKQEAIDNDREFNRRRE